MGVGAILIIFGGRAQLRGQAQSELAVTEINYNIKINQMGFGFRGQSENTAIIEAALAHSRNQLLSKSLEGQVKQILQNEMRARQIEYATLVDKDLRIIVNANATLELVPEPIILYSDSALEQNTTIKLDSTARLFLSEIIPIISFAMLLAMCSAAIPSSLAAHKSPILYIVCFKILS